MAYFLVADEAYVAIKLVNSAVALYAYVVLGHARTAKECGGAFIAGFCVDFHFKKLLSSLALSFLAAQWLRS